MASSHYLERTYFIGGAPRIGKTKLAFRAGQILNAHVISTDSIVSALQFNNSHADLLAVRQYDSLEESAWIDAYSSQPSLIVEAQNRESFAAWGAIEAFCIPFQDDTATHIIEGVAAVPALVSRVAPPRRAVFVGNTSPDHVHQILKNAQTDPDHDWVAAVGLSSDRIHALARYVTEMSAYFKTEATRFGYSYFEMDDSNFEESQMNVINYLQETMDE